MDQDKLQEYIKKRRVKNKVHVKRLMNENPHCYYCRIECKYYPEFRTGNLKRGQSYPHDMATLEHLFDRYDPIKRYRVYENDEDKVLACYKCNYSRSQQRTDSMPKEYLERRKELLAARKKGQIRPIILKELEEFNLKI